MSLIDKYVANASSGTGDGSSAANAMGWSAMLTEINAGGAAGTRYNVKGPIARAASDSLTSGGSVASPVVIRGYNSVIGDGYLGRTSGNGPLITTNMATVTYSTGFRLVANGSSFTIFECLVFSGSVNNAQVAGATDQKFKSCSITNSNTGALAGCISFSSGQRSLLFDCDVQMTGASGGTVAAFIGGAATGIIGGRYTAVSCPAVTANATTFVLHALIYSAGTHGLTTTATSAFPLIYGNTIVSAASDGINVFTGTTGTLNIVNNLITDCTSDGLNMVSTSNGAFLAYNRFRDNGVNILNGGDWIDATRYGHVTTGNGTSDYVNAGAGDYSLIAASPAVGAGIPSPASIGAMQVTGGSGGGGFSPIGEGSVCKVGNYGDVIAGSAIQLFFSTRRRDTGALAALAGSPVVSVYKSGSTTESTAGVTLTTDYDSRTGLNRVAIDTSADGAFYTAGSNFSLVITAGTVNGDSVAGEVVGHFSIENRTQYADVRKLLGTAWLTPAVAGTPDVNARLIGGTVQAVGRDICASVLLSPGTGVGQVALSGGAVLLQTTQPGVTIPNVTTVGSVTGNVGGSVGSVAGNVGGSVASVVGSVGSVIGAVTTSNAADVTAIRAKTDNLPALPASTTNITAGTITTVTNLTNAPTAGDFTLTMKTSLTNAIPSSSTIAAAVWNALTAGITTADSIGKRLLDFVTSLVYSAPLSASGTRAAIGMNAADLDAQLDAILAASGGGGGGGGGGGSGANTVTITVTDTDDEPLQGATVRALLNGSTSGIGQSDVDGVVILALDDANYSVNVTCGGYNGQVNTLAVNGVETATYQLTELNISPSPPGTVTGYGYTYATDGSTVQSGVVVYIQMTAAPSGGVGLIDPRLLSATSDSNGLVQFTGLRPLATYRVMTSRGPARRTFVAPSTTFEIPAMIV